MPNSNLHPVFENILNSQLSAYSGGHSTCDDESEIGTVGDGSSSLEQTKESQN
jgi:hypothetical protein